MPIIFHQFWLFLQDLNTVVALRGITAFDVVAHSVTDNETQIILETTVGNVRLVGHSDMGFKNLRRPSIINIYIVLKECLF